MNFELNEEQQALQGSLARLLGDVYGFEQRRAVAATPAGWSQPVWQQLSELGLTALPLPQAHGGFGGGAVALLPVMQELGRALSLEPFLASIVLGATALRLAGSETLQAQLMPDVASGEVRLAWAHDEAAGHQAALWVETTARREGDQWLLDGIKCNVLHAPAAHRFVVSARIADAPGAPGDASGLALFLVDASARGVSCRAHRMVDDTPGGELHFKAAAGVPLGDPHDGAAVVRAIEGTLAAGIAAVCADAVGAMESAYRLAIDYLNTRKQFGRLIGENQALRHRAGGNARQPRDVPQHGIGRGHCGGRPRCDRCTCRSCARQAHDRPAWPQPLPRGHPAARRHRHDRGIRRGHCLRRVTLIDQLFGDVEAQATRLAEMQ
jgi:pimeloyl-CoA dehydrogenase